MFETDPLCICGHGPHTNRKCSDCGHPEFVRTDVAIARALTSLTALVKIADVVGSRWLELVSPEVEQEEKQQGQEQGPDLDNLSPLFPSKLSEALSRASTGTSTEEQDHGDTDAQPTES